MIEMDSVKEVNPDYWLKKLILGHIVPGSLPVALLQSGSDLTTLSGLIIKVDVSADGNLCSLN